MKASFNPEDACIHLMAETPIEAAALASFSNETGCEADIVYNKTGAVVLKLETNLNLEEPDDKERIDVWGHTNQSEKEGT